MSPACQSPLAICFQLRLCFYQVLDLHSIAICCVYHCDEFNTQNQNVTSQGQQQEVLGEKSCSSSEDSRRRHKKKERRCHHHRVRETSQARTRPVAEQESQDQDHDKEVNPYDTWKVRELEDACNGKRLGTNKQRLAKLLQTLAELDDMKSKMRRDQVSHLLQS